IESTIFTTETTASWFINPAPVARSQPVRIEAEVKIATTEGDFEERARRIAEAIRESGIHVAFFYSNLAEQITSRVASMRPAPVQIHVNLDSDMRSDLFNAHIHLSENARRRSKLSGPSACIPPVSDIESSLRMH